MLSTVADPKINVPFSLFFYVYQSKDFSGVRIACKMRVVVEMQTQIMRVDKTRVVGSIKTKECEQRGG